MNQNVFEQLVAQHYADLYRFAFSLARNATDAADLTQQAYATLAAKGDQVRDPAKFKTWLFTTLYRDFLKEGARSLRQIPLSEADLDAVSPPQPSDSQRALERREVLVALAALDDNARAILSLFYIDQTSYREIATILDLPIGTVMSRLARAKAALREQLENGGNSLE